MANHQVEVLILCGMPHTRQRTRQDDLTIPPLHFHNHIADCFPLRHGVGGFVGDILTGFFAASFVPAMDGVSNTYEGGWWDHNWKQMGYQLAAACTCALWSFIISLILLSVINKIPGLHLRATEEDELRGLDFKYLMDVDSEGDMMVVSGMGSVTPGLSSGTSQEGVNVTVPEKRD